MVECDQGGQGLGDSSAIEESRAERHGQLQRIPEITQEVRGTHGQRMGW